MNKIIGIDPGSALCGWAVIEAEPGRTGRLVASGCIKTSPKDTTAKRLEKLFDELTAVIKKYHPHEAAVEELFFVQNIKTGIVVGQARGAILLALSQAGLPVFEYKPTVVKMALTSYGRAEKKQVQSMVKLMLKLDKEIKQDDEADAVAVALCHSQHSNCFNHANNTVTNDTRINHANDRVDQHSNTRELVSNQHANDRVQESNRPQKSVLVYPELSYEIVGAIYDTFNQLGPGLQEKYYQALLKKKLAARNLKYCEQLKVNIDNLPIKIGRYFLDFVVEDKVVIELKAGARFKKCDIDQVMSYLRQSGLELGIIARFGKDGVLIKRLLKGR